MNHYMRINSSGTIVYSTKALPLHIEGRYIKDSLGRNVILRGVNERTSFMADRNGWWTPEGSDPSSGCHVWDLDAIRYNLDKSKELGMNVWRMGVNPIWLDQGDEVYWEHLHTIANLMSERGIYLVTSYWDYPLPYFSEDQAIFPSEDAYVRFMVNYARNMSVHENVIIELWNEPVPDHGDSPFEEFVPLWASTCQKTIDAIRKAGVNNLILVDWEWGVWWDWSNDDPVGWGITVDWIRKFNLNGTNIVYSEHLYSAAFFDSIHQSGYKEPTREMVYHQLDSCLLRKCVNEWNKPLIAGEIGMNSWWKYESSSGAGELYYGYLKTLEYMYDYLNENEIGYIHWAWTHISHMSTGIFEVDNWLPPFMDVGELLYAKINNISYKYPLFSTEARSENDYLGLNSLPHVVEETSYWIMNVRVENISYNDRILEIHIRELEDLADTGYRWKIKVYCGSLGQPQSVSNATLESYDTSSKIAAITLTLTSSPKIVVLQWSI